MDSGRIEQKVKKKKREPKRKKLRERETSMVTAGEQRVERGGEGTERIFGDGRRLPLGW